MFIKKYKFKERDNIAPSMPGVYAVCLERRGGYRILYIGSSKNIYRRVSRPDHPYYKISKRKYYKYGELCLFCYLTDDYIRIEKELIIKTRPFLNKAHKK